MIDPAGYLELVSGRRRGVGAALARGGLSLAALGYRAGVAWRNRSFDRGGRSIARAEVPVVSVGNLTLGGTGKTPCVAWLARWWRQRQVRVTILSRGYGAGDAGANDEALELEDLLPDVPHLQDPDRAAMARLAVEEFESQLLLLDDGFQHRQLARDLDLVLLDALNPWGFGRVFPRGLLREPVAGLARADVVGLTRADLVSPQARSEIRGQALRHNPRAIWLELSHRPRGLRNAGGVGAPLERLAAQRVAAFCGLGNPEGFRRTLAEAGFDLAALRPFPDHHRYRREDLTELGRWASELGVAALVTTHKDLVKIEVDELAGCPLWALAVELEFLSGQAELEDRLDQLHRERLA